MEVPSNLDSLLEGSELMRTMSFGRMPTLYNVLQIDTTASKTKVREAYIRLKHAYSVQSQALYSLMDDEAARNSMLEIEEAFRILNDDHLRKEYDDKLRLNGQLPKEAVIADSDQPKSDPFGKSEKPELLGSLGAQRSPYFRSNSEDGATGWTHNSDRGSEEPESAFSVKQPREFAAVLKVNHRVQLPHQKEAIEAIVRDAVDKGDGAVYRQMREIIEVSEFEVQQRTKISVEYIKAIENNSFDRLPAMVYVRGFLKSYLQYLGVADPRTMIDAFAERMMAWQKTRNAN